MPFQDKVSLCVRTLQQGGTAPEERAGKLQQVTPGGLPSALIMCYMAGFPL